MPNRRVSTLGPEEGTTTINSDTTSEAFMRSNQFSLRDKEFEGSDTFSILAKIKQEQEQAPKKIKPNNLIKSESKIKQSM